LNILLQRQLQWIRHVIRMSLNRLPHQVLHGELSHGQRLLGRRKLRFRDHISRILKQCNIPLTDLQLAASDRDRWSNLCHDGLKALAISSKQATTKECCSC